MYTAEDPKNPESKTPPPPSGPFVTVFAAFNAQNLIGPYVTTGNADQHTYHLYLLKLVYELRQLLRMNLKLYDPIFMHDDSPLHENEAKLLDEEFSNYWIGPGSKHGEWPWLSPDMNPLCFFLWGFIKSKVYEKPIENDDITELSIRIQQAFTEIMPEMLEEVAKAYKERLKLVVKEDGKWVDVHEDEENVTKQIDISAIPSLEL